MRYSVAAAAAMASLASASVMGTGSPMPSVVTEVLTSYETYCPGPTSFTYGTQTYTMTDSGTLTFTEPCTITRTLTSSTTTECTAWYVTTIYYIDIEIEIDIEILTSAAQPPPQLLLLPALLPAVSPEPAPPSQFQLPPAAAPPSTHHQPTPTRLLRLPPWALPAALASSPLLCQPTPALPRTPLSVPEPVSPVSSALLPFCCKQSMEGR